MNWDRQHCYIGSAVGSRAGKKWLIGLLICTERYQFSFTQCHHHYCHHHHHICDHCYHCQQHRDHKEQIVLWSGGWETRNAKWDVGDVDGDGDDSDDDGDGETCEEVVGKAGEGEHCTGSTLPAGKSLILFQLFPLFIGHRSNPWLSYSEHLRWWQWSILPWWTRRSRQGDVVRSGNRSSLEDIRPLCWQKCAPEEDRSQWGH